MELFAVAQIKTIINSVYCIFINELLYCFQDRLGSNTLCKDI